MGLSPHDHQLLLGLRASRTGRSARRYRRSRRRSRPRWRAGSSSSSRAGNGHFGFPGQHPDVISAGGVVHGGRRPMHGLELRQRLREQHLPRAQRARRLRPRRDAAARRSTSCCRSRPGDDIDVGNAGGTHPNGDETANNDGWAAFSGTSAAAPQIAGVCALIKQACPRLTPAEVRTSSRARRATSPPARATRARATRPAPGPDLATGHGLVDAHRAVLMAKVRCLRADPADPRPSSRIQPIQPIAADHADPADHGPAGDADPADQPITPVQPIRRSQPIAADPAPIGRRPRGSAGPRRRPPVPSLPRRTTSRRSRT